jgi:hypothetical protein
VTGDNGAPIDRTHAMSMEAVAEIRRMYLDARVRLGLAPPPKKKDER